MGKSSCCTVSTSYEEEKNYGSVRAEPISSSIGESLQDLQNNVVTASDMIESSLADTRNKLPTGGTVVKKYSFRGVARAKVLLGSCNINQEGKRLSAQRKFPKFDYRSNSFGKRSF